MQAFRSLPSGLLTRASRGRSRTPLSSSLIRVICIRENQNHCLSPEVSFVFIVNRWPSARVQPGVGS